MSDQGGDQRDAREHIRIRRHRFSGDILEAVRAQSRGDNWHGPLEAVTHWAVVAGWVVMSSWAWRALPVLPALAAYLLALVCIGGRQRALAGVLHQACHRTLMASPRAGAVVGSLFGGYPVLQSYSGYRASHVLEHHAHLGDPVRDPDYVQYQRYSLCGPRMRKAALRAHLRRLLGPRLTLSYVAYLLRHRVLVVGEVRWERVLRLSLTVAVLVAAARFGCLGALAAYWVLPLVTTQVWAGSVAELLEHYPIIEVGDRTTLHTSWNRRVSLSSRLLLGEREGEGYHLVHHLFPRVPLWRLKQVDQVLRRDAEYAALPRLGTATAAVVQIYRALPPAQPAAAWAAA
ncbi:fatty acid desaturase [Parafrankia sp. FMc6]|uniref:fatty acid desaturase family protein n=1 Tax=Parafrankia soli TaxID=2599596 RepID=UPI0034D466D1